MKFLVTGLPRTRSAWWAALLGVEHSPKFYRRDVGVSDPVAACQWPVRYLPNLDNAKILIVERDPTESRTALERWCGEQIPIAAWDSLVANYKAFCVSAKKLNSMFVPFHRLDDYKVVSTAYRHLTGELLPQARFDLFNGLKIEQHLGKARCALDSAA